MKRAHTPEIDGRRVNQEYPTPTKSKVQGAIAYADYLAKTGLPHTKQRAFEFFDVERRSGYRMLEANGAEDSEQEAGESGRRGAHTSKSEARGAKPKIQPYHVRKMEEIINSGDINQRALSWQQLATKAGLTGENQVHFHTVRALMQDLEYHKCIACTKNWLASQIRAERRRFAQAYIHWKKAQWRTSSLDRRDSFRTRTSGQSFALYVDSVNDIASTVYRNKPSLKNRTRNDYMLGP